MKDKNLKDILNDVLNIVGYEDDKSEFIDIYIDGTHKQAIVFLINSLEEEKQDEINEALEKVSTLDDKTNVLKQYFSQQEYEEALKEASKKIFMEIVSEVQGILTDDQKKKLHSYLKTIAS